MINASKATRIRKKILDGSATEEMRAQLAAYEATTSKRGPTPHATAGTNGSHAPHSHLVGPAGWRDEPIIAGSRAEHAEPVSTAPASSVDGPPTAAVPPGPSEPAPRAQPPPPPSVSQATRVPVATWVPPAERHKPAPEHKPAGICPVGPDCPGCQGAMGGTICATSGRRVWPRMSEVGAEMQAAAFLGLLATGIRLLTGEEVNRATHVEIKSMGAAIREVTYRRASVLGAFDDVISFAGHTSNFVTSRYSQASEQAKQRRTHGRVTQPLPRVVVRPAPAPAPSVGAP